MAEYITALSVEVGYSGAIAMAAAASFGCGLVKFTKALENYSL